VAWSSRLAKVVLLKIVGEPFAIDRSGELVEDHAHPDRTGFAGLVVASDNVPGGVDRGVVRSGQHGVDVDLGARFEGGIEFKPHPRGADIINMPGPAEFVVTVGTNADQRVHGG